MDYSKKAHIAILIIFSFILASMTTLVSAIDNEKRSESVHNGMYDFVLEALPFMIEQGNISNSQKASGYKVEVGASLPLYCLVDGVLTSAEYQSFPVFVNTSLVALIRVHFNDANIPIYTCVLDVATEISKLDTAGKYVFLYAEEGLFAYDREGHTYQLQSMTLMENSSIESLSFSTGLLDAKAESIRFVSIAAVEEVCSMESIASYDSRKLEYDSVPLLTVSNATTQCCSGGICWAACHASIANYYTGSNYTALTYHNSENCTNYKSNYHYYEKVFLNNKGISVSGPNTTQLTYSTLKSYVDSGAVALLDLQAATAGGAHNVVAHGYINSSGYKFYYMDPNSGTCLSSFPTSGKLQITASGILYNVHCNSKCY